MIGDTSKFTKALSGFFSLIAAGLLASAVMGATYCIQYDRWKERQCLNQGGALMSNATPGMSGRDACMKIQIQMTPVALPGQP